MSNESMANSITDVPSAIAELLAVNKQLKQELQKTKEQLEKLEEDSVFLGFLEECGVDNWDGYSDAWKLTKQKLQTKDKTDGKP